MTSRKSRSILVCILLLGLAVRIVVMLALRSYHIPAEADHWAFGFEDGRIASALASGHGFSSPLPEPSGPTMFRPPGYALILSAIFRVFGIYTTQSAVAAYLLNCLFSVLTCVALYRLGERIFSREVGLLAAACLALYPWSIWHSVNTVWDTTLTGFAMTALLAWLCGLPERPGDLRMAVTGLFMGVVALINPATGLFYVAAALILWKRLRERGAGGFRQIAILTAACLLVCVPWMVRNAVVMGSFAPRSGFGLNLRLGNNDTAWRLGTGVVDYSIYPSNSVQEGRLFYQMGEIAYDRYCSRLGVQYIREHPGRFAGLTGMRLRAWWVGQESAWRGNVNLRFDPDIVKALSWLVPLPLFILGCIVAWRKRLAVGLLVAAVFIFPVPYYFMIAAERYRFPIEPLVLLLASYGAVQLWRWAARRPADDPAAADPGSSSGSSEQPAVV